MPELKVPVVVSGVKIMRKAIEDIHIDLEQSTQTSDYIAGFLFCRECILNVLYHLEGMGHCVEEE